MIEAGVAPALAPIACSRRRRIESPSSDRLPVAMATASWASAMCRRCSAVARSRVRADGDGGLAALAGGSGNVNDDDDADASGIAPAPVEANPLPIAPLPPIALLPLPLPLPVLPLPPAMLGPRLASHASKSCTLPVLAAVMWPDAAAADSDGSPVLPWPLSCAAKPALRLPAVAAAENADAASTLGVPR